MSLWSRNWGVKPFLIFFKAKGFFRNGYTRQAWPASLHWVKSVGEVTMKECLGMCVRIPKCKHFLMAQLFWATENEMPPWQSGNQTNPSLKSCPANAQYSVIFNKKIYRVIGLCWWDRAGSTWHSPLFPLRVRLSKAPLAHPCAVEDTTSFLTKKMRPSGRNCPKLPPSLLPRNTSLMKMCGPQNAEEKKLPWVMNAMHYTIPSKICNIH